MLRNLLATRNGRLAAFFALYLTEGIPLGFTATAVATQMRRQGLGPAAIGAFVGSLYLPWAFKWAVGPFVDVFGAERFGRRRVWIVAMQCLMVAAPPGSPALCAARDSVSARSRGRRTRGSVLRRPCAGIRSRPPSARPAPAAGRSAPRPCG